MYFMSFRGEILMLMRMCLVACLILGSVNKSDADVVITGWNFNSVVPDDITSTGTTAPSVGTGTASRIGGTNANFATGAGSIGGADNSGWNVTTWAAQGTGSGTRGVQFTASTAGFTNIVLDMDLRMSGTVSRFFQLQATSDGSTNSNVSGGVANIPTDFNNNIVANMSNAGLIEVISSDSGQQFAEGFRYRFATNSLFENNANFGFRLLSVFDPVDGSNYISSNAGTTSGTGGYSTTGTFRLDNIAIRGVPEPTSIALLSVAGFAGLAANYRRRKATKSAAV
jgi:hypothetical protein